MPAIVQIAYGLLLPRASDAIGTKPNGTTQLSSRSVFSARTCSVSSSRPCAVSSGRPVLMLMPHCTQMRAPKPSVLWQHGHVGPPASVTCDGASPAVGCPAYATVVERCLATGGSGAG